MANIFKLILAQKSGLLTQLESDTIFGHFCWRMKEINGEEKLFEFLKHYKEGSPVFTISNSFFERNGVIYLPKPLLPYKEKENPEGKDEKIKMFVDYKNSKERKLLTLEQFNFALNGKREKLEESFRIENEEKKRCKNEGKDLEKFKLPEYIEDLRTSVEIDRNTFSSKEHQLFSYAPSYVDEIIVDKEKQTHSVTNNIIFIKVIDQKYFGDFNCQEILKEVFIVGYGKKKSSGYGEFEVITKNLLDEEFKGFEEADESNGFLTLSNYLPSDSDALTDYFYEFKIKFGKLGEELALSENPFKKPIVLLLPGSVFKTADVKEFYGRCTTDGELSDAHRFAIQNGIAFSLKIII